MEKILIGKIIKAQGIKGEVKINAFTDDLSRFKKAKSLYFGETLYKILSARTDNNFAYLSLSGIDDRNKAELLVGSDVFVDKVNAVNLPNDRYFITDMIGCDVVLDAMTPLGKIVDIAQNGSADVYTVIKLNGKKVLFPFLQKLVNGIDIVGKVVDLKSSVFDEVCVDED